MPRATIKPKTKVLKKYVLAVKANSSYKCVKYSENVNFLSYFWLCFNSKQRPPQLHNLRFAPLRSFIFRFFSLPNFSPSFRFFLLNISQKVFSINYLNLLVFFNQSPKRFARFLSIDTPIFLYYHQQGFGRFSYTITFIIDLHTYRSSRPKKEAIVMT